jgi:hypothetical protein
MTIRSLSLLACCLLSVLAVAEPPATGLVFDGFHPWAVPGKDVVLNPTALSFATWVRVQDNKESQVFLNQGKAGTLTSFYLYNGKVRMLVENKPGSYTFAMAEPPQPDEWTHYAGSYDGKTIRVYRNGKLAAKAKAAGSLAKNKASLFVGSLNDFERFLKGDLADIRVWNRTLADSEVAAVYAGETGGELDNELLARWTADSKQDTQLVSLPPGTLAARQLEMGSLLINEKADGFRGIWYYNQKIPNEYVYKYSGGLGTYCAKHIPMAWYAPKANKTFFCYGGTDEQNSTLYHMVSYYDHATGMVARPTVLLDKKTTDAHDNPVINIDDDGYIWIFSSSHGTGRPSYISRSAKPYDIDTFELVWTGNFSYPQPWYMPGQGFLFLHTYYKGGRGLNMWTSQDCKTWTERRLLSHIEMGQYQVSFRGDGKLGTAFNMHPAGKGLNWRTNLYYMETKDFGKTWQTVDGKTLELPIMKKDNPALVAEYQSKSRNVYMKDVSYDSKGNPIILVVTSGGYASGPANDPRTWTTARWTGSEWDIREAFKSDNNYDTGPLYVESDTTWRIIGPTQPGPQPYNPGGEIAMWLTKDAGAHWEMVKQMTANSEFNHTYVRRPVNAQPDFYGIWADGHGRQPSKSRLYYCNRAGDVFRLPEVVTEPMVKAEKLD